MKLKEFPGSVWRAFQLGRIPVHQLHESSVEALPVVVSFTSIPSRFHVIHLTVRSILAGSKKPEKIVLWLHESLKNRVPHSLSKLVGARFEIRYAVEDCPHLKLVNSLKSFGDKVIVTCDDDLMYAKNWLETLYADHLAHPQDIIAHECRAVNYDEQGEVRPYYYWYKEARRGFTYAAILPLGYAGVLYPVGCLHEDTCNEKLYLDLAPKADDLWFKAMAYLKGTAARTTKTSIIKPIPIFNSQSVSLKATNVKQDGNRKQWEAIKAHYQLPAFAPLVPPQQR